MGTTINAANIAVGFDASKLKAGTQLARTEVSQLGRDLKASVAPIDNLRNRQRVLEEAYKSGAITMQLHARTAAHLSSEIKGLSKAHDLGIGSVVKYAAAYASARAVVGQLSSSIKLAAELEGIGVQFEVMTGAKKDADGLVSSMRELANTTPLSFRGVSGAAQTMLAFGVETQKVMPLLVQLGNITRADDERLKSMSLAFSQMSSAGRLMGQDLLQMINAGFNPLQEISARTGVSMGELKKRMEDGGISVNLVEMAFQSATSEGGRFYGMLDRSRDTLQGQWAEVVSDIEAIKVKLGQELMPVVKEVTGALSDMFNTGSNMNLSWIGQSIEGVQWWQANVKDFFATAILAPDTGKAHTGYMDEFNKRKEISRAKEIAEGKRIAEEMQRQAPTVNNQMIDQLQRDQDAIRQLGQKRDDLVDGRKMESAKKQTEDLLALHARELEQAKKRLEIEKYGKAIAEQNEAIRKGIPGHIAKQIGEMVRQTEELERQHQIAERMKRGFENDQQREQQKQEEAKHSGTDNGPIAAQTLKAGTAEAYRYLMTMRREQTNKLDQKQTQLAADQLKVQREMLQVWKNAPQLICYR